MTQRSTILVREPRGEEHAWIERQLRHWWGATLVVGRARQHDASRLPALVAVQDDELVGLATFNFEDGECELVTLNSLREGQGVGSALLPRVAKEAAEHGCRRLWLITSNDNLRAIRFLASPFTMSWSLSCCSTERPAGSGSVRGG